MSRNRFREVTKGDAPRKMWSPRTGVLKLTTASGKAYGAVIGMMDGSPRLARQKFTTDREARAYRMEAQERYEVLELTYQLDLALRTRPWWRKALDWLRARTGRKPYPTLVVQTGMTHERGLAELDIAERQRLVRQIEGMG